MLGLPPSLDIHSLDRSTRNSESAVKAAGGLSQVQSFINDQGCWKCKKMVLRHLENVWKRLKTWPQNWKVQTCPRRPPKSSTVSERTLFLSTNSRSAACGFFRSNHGPNPSIQKEVVPVTSNPLVENFLDPWVDASIFLNKMVNIISNY